MAGQPRGCPDGLKTIVAGQNPTTGTQKGSPKAKKTSKVAQNATNKGETSFIDAEKAFANGDWGIVFGDRGSVGADRGNSERVTRKQAQQCAGAKPIACHESCYCEPASPRSRAEFDPFHTRTVTAEAKRPWPVKKAAPIGAAFLLREEGRLSLPSRWSRVGRFWFKPPAGGRAGAGLCSPPCRPRPR